MTGVVLRRAVPKDAAAIARLVNQLEYEGDRSAVARRLAALAAAPHQRLIVAAGPDGVAGLVHVKAEPSLLADRTAQIVALVVEENWRSRGVGRALLEEAEAWAAARGCERVQLYSNAKRVRAHRFYFANGFAKVKESLMLEKQLAAKGAENVPG
jgi:N-acetylglutamate synthase-like GNAT family acetyltransferase